jgi:hypothetical protein
MTDDYQEHFSESGERVNETSNNSSIEEAMEEDRETQQLMSSLLKNKGWQALAGMLTADLAARRNEYELNESTGMDAMISREFLRGEIAMLRTMLQLPTDLKEGADAALRMRQRQLDTVKGQDDDRTDN